MNAFKYPRTFHLPWSAAITDDDKVLGSDSHFEGSVVIVTEKMDGECTTILPNRIHARSLDSPMTEWREPVKNLWSRFAHTIPDGFRICGENVVAVHSIRYTNLPSCFLAFSVWENDVCLSWDDSQEFTRMICEDAGIPSSSIEWVPVLYRGIYDRTKIHSEWTQTFASLSEGYVIRKEGSFRYDEFSKNLGKYVRANHVQTSTHWTHEQIRYNDYQR